MFGDKIIPQWPPGLTIVDGKDMAIYGTNAYFPASHILDERVGIGRQYKVVDVLLYPFLYNPVTMKLKVLVSGQVKVNFATIPGFVVTIPRSEWYEESLRDQIDNDTAIFQLYTPATSIIHLSGPAKGKKGGMSVLFSGERFRIPAAYAGNTNSITFFDMMGKKLHTIITKEPVICFEQNKSSTEKQYIARIMPLE